MKPVDVLDLDCSSQGVDFIACALLWLQCARSVFWSCLS